MAERVAVIGAGIAGMFVHRFLKARGLDVTLFGSLAQSTRPPAALLHPFPGRSMEMDEEVRHAYELASNVAREMGARQVTVERPAPSGSREYKSYERCKTTYPAWLNHTLSGDTLRYGPAWVFDLRQTFMEDFIDEQVECVQVADQPRVVCQNQRSEFLAVVVCPGAELLDWWQIAASAFGGEMVLCDKPHDPSIVIGGALHQLPCEDGRLAFGHTFIQSGVIRTDEDVLTEYSTRSGEPLTGEVWRGRRFVNIDRQPVCGKVANDVYVLGALGARGLLLGPMLADLLARQIVGEDVQIPPKYNVSRASGVAGPRLLVNPGFFA